MRALFLICSLKRSSAPSNTEVLARVVAAEMERGGVQTEFIRLADRNVIAGVNSDEGPGDEWPPIRAKILDSDILIIATPTWLGQASSLCQRALERMDAMIGERKDDGTPVAFCKVAGIVVTGNEDGAHHIVGTTCQALIDIGFTIPAQAWTYWHLGPGPGPNYLDTDQAHDYADRTGRNAARNVLAVARALATIPLPVPEREE